MLTIRRLTTPADLDAAFVLRHRVCVDELGWVPPRPGGREIDEWDGDALHVGAFSRTDGALAAYVRVVPDSAERSTMTHRCFADLITAPDPRPPMAVTGDLSRFVVDRDHRRRDAVAGLSVAIVDHARELAMAAGQRYWYVVTGRPQLALLHLHYDDVRVLGSGVTPDGGTTSVVLVDLRSRVVSGALSPA